MNLKDLNILLTIAKNEGRIISTNKLSNITGISQQSISRKIRDMEREGLIERKIFNNGQILMLTENGRKLLMSIYRELDSLLGKVNEIFSFSGVVVSGSGEGKYYIGLKKYFTQFEKKLAFKPYKGTLNLMIEPYVRIRIAQKKPIHIDGFKMKGRTFGGISCFLCRINKKIKGAVIIPERTHHPEEIIEIISPYNLRKKLSLKDGDKINVEVI